jgi:hypothetical protein
MTNLERLELLVALYALKDASEWYQKESETRSRMVTGLFAKRRNADLERLARRAKRNGDDQIAPYHAIIDQIPKSWYTVPMCEHLIIMVENGYGESVKDLVARYKWYFRDLTEAGAFNEAQAGA